MQTLVTLQVAIPYADPEHPKAPKRDPVRNRHAKVRSPTAQKQAGSWAGEILSYEPRTRQTIEPSVVVQRNFAQDFPVRPQDRGDGPNPITSPQLPFPRPAAD